MQYPEACAGVKKIYTAEILSLIATVLTVTVVLSPVAAILFIISFVLKIVGINRAARDEGAFKNALIAVVVGIAASILVGLTKNDTFMHGLGSTVNDVCNFLVSYLVCRGIVNLANRLGDEEIAARGQKVMKLLTIVWAIAIVIRILSAILGGGNALNIVLTIVSGVCAIVAYVLYLKLLSRARPMLER